MKKNKIILATIIACCLFSGCSNQIVKENTFTEKTFHDLSETDEIILESNNEEERSFSKDEEIIENEKTMVSESLIDISENNTEDNISENIVEEILSIPEENVLSEEESSIEHEKDNLLEIEETIIETEEITMEVEEPTYIVTEVEPYTVYAITSLNLRSGPGVDFDKTGLAYTNNELTVLAKVDNGWIKVLHNENEYFCSEKYTSLEKVVIPTPTPEPVPVYNDSPYYNIVGSESAATNNVANKANNYWNNNIPDSLKSFIVDNGWKITVSDQKLMDRFGYDVIIAGITVYAEQTIYLDNRESVIKRAFIHELGHVIDQINGWPSSSEEFTQYFEEEKANLRASTSIGDGHEISSTVEYFAEIFQEIYVNGANCQSQVPKSYEFVMRYVP